MVGEISGAGSLCLSSTRDKMADRVATRLTAVLQVPQNLIENKCYECTNWVELERELKKILDEISTYQFIVELLRK